MPTALFYNFSDYPFTGRWGGEDETFQPKEKRYMPAFLAQHFAKHLVNRELHRQGKDHATSPKAPEDMPEFNVLFRMAYVRDRDLPGKKRNNLRDMIDSVHLNRTGDTPAPAVAVPPSTLGPDVDPKTGPRQPSPEEAPDYTPEKAAEVPEGTPPMTARSTEPQIVTPPDFEDDDEGYEGVAVPPPAAETTSK